MSGEDPGKNNESCTDRRIARSASSEMRMMNGSDIATLEKILGQWNMWMTELTRLHIARTGSRARNSEIIEESARQSVD